MEKILSNFFAREWEYSINEAMLEYNYDYPYEKVQNYIQDVCNIPLKNMLDFILNSFSVEELTKSDFMQFSDPKDATVNLCAQFKKQNGEGLEAYEIGKLLLDSGKKHEAYRKYGEGNAKAGTALGLLSCYSNVYFLSAMGYVFPELDHASQKRLLSRLVLRLPEYSQLLLRLSINEKVNLREYMELLTDSTYLRRRSTFKNLLRMLTDGEEELFAPYLSKLLIP